MKSCWRSSLTHGRQATKRRETCGRTVTTQLFSRRSGWLPDDEASQRRWFAMEMKRIELLLAA